MPVILAKAPEGFIAELTYGDEVNWYRNTEFRLLRTDSSPLLGG